MSRRDEVLGAAIEVLAERGSRGFHHRAVETAAGVDWTRKLCRDWLKSVGAPDPETGATLLIAVHRALIMEKRVHPDRDIDLADVYRPVVWGLLHPAD